MMGFSEGYVLSIFLFRLCVRTEGHTGKSREQENHEVRNNHALVIYGFCSLLLSFTKLVFHDGTHTYPIRQSPIISSPVSRNIAGR